MRRHSDPTVTVPEFRPQDTSTAVRAGERGRGTIRTILLVCGILAPLLYVAMNIVGAVQFGGYSSVSQTISELSAIGAPSRALWVRLGIAYDVLVVAFGLGVWLSARGRRALHVVGALLVVDGLIGFAWPPMHLRGAGTSLTDGLHIAFTGVSVVLVLIALGVGANAFGKRFRIYSISSIAISLAFGALTSAYGPRIPKNLPTPWVGVWERISAGAFLLWIAVFATALLQPEEAAWRRIRAAERRVDALTAESAD